jgi:hypothetical protein
MEDHNYGFGMVCDGATYLSNPAELQSCNGENGFKMGNEQKELMFSRAFAKLREATINFNTSVCLSVSLSLSVRPSVRPSAWNNSTPTERIFMKFDI